MAGVPFYFARKEKRMTEMDQLKSGIIEAVESSNRESAGGFGYQWRDNGFRCQRSAYIVGGKCRNGVFICLMRANAGWEQVERSI